MTRRFFALFHVFACLAVPTAATAQPTVTMTDLGTLPGGTYSSAVAVNEVGDAVGLAVRADGINHAVLFRGGEVIDLGSLCDTPACANNYSNAGDINDHGAIVGVSYNASGEVRGFIWQNGVMAALPILAGSSSTAATAINNLGQIVGRACGANGCRAIRWSSPTNAPEELGMLGIGGGTAYSVAHDLNEAGQIVGESTIAGTTFRMHAFVWDSVNGMRDLGGIGLACLDRSWATAINSHGDIAGGLYVSCGGNTHMARWTGGVFQDLGSLVGAAGRSSIGKGISDAGLIPGSSDGKCGESEAVWWSQGVMTPLGGPYVVRDGCHMSFAMGINNRGQIVGQIYTGHDPLRPGEVHAALWQVQVMAPPVVSAGPDVMGNEGSAIVLNGSVSDSGAPSAVRTWTYSAAATTTGTCAFGNANSAATTITCSDNGDYTATLTADDGVNSPVSSSAGVRVTNVIPAAVLSAPTAVDERQSFTLAFGGVSDASSADTAAGFSYSFDCGSGYGAFSSAAAITCTAPALGTGSTSLTVRGRVADKDGGASEYLADITLIDTTAPVLSLMNASTIATSGTGATVTFSATAIDNVDGPLAPSCSPSSGSVFAIGTTTVQCSATDTRGNTAHGSFTVTVRYNTCLLYDSTKVHRSGSTVPIKLQLCSASGENLSSPGVAVRAQSLVLVSSEAAGAVEDAGQSNPDDNFRYDASLGGYVFNLKTTGLPVGSYELRFSAGNSPGVSGAPFKVR